MIASNNVPDFITPRPFFKSMIGAIPGLSCGASKAAVQAVDWLYDNRYPSVRTDLKAGAKVWLYQNSANDLTGFGSLGFASWELRGVPTKIQYIPMLGVFIQFQGRPDPASGEVKYCYQIIDHLIDEARTRASEYPWLGLSVHKDNPEAVHIYERSGFAWKQDGKFSRMLVWLG